MLTAIVLAAVANSHSKCLTCSFFPPFAKVDLWDTKEKKTTNKQENKKL